MNYLEQQIRLAKDNYNYFFMKMIFENFKVLLNLSVVLFLGSIFNYLFINIIVLIYAVYSVYSIYIIYKYYFDIINDIKHTLGYDNLVFEIDFSMFNFNFLKGMVRYGK